MLDNDDTQRLQQQVSQAVSDKTPLSITAGQSKHFYGNQINGKTLDVSEHSGIVSYEPTELVVTVRAGTNLKELEQVLRGENQMLAFEPPAYADSATIGGTIACNLSGPRRAFSGAARDFVLGSKIINGKGESIRFGGEVMKNVAGYDVSRLMCGAMGTLGLILELSIKVLPKPEVEQTLAFEMNSVNSLSKVHQLGQTALPISATSFTEDKLYIRLSGSEGAVVDACQRIGGEKVANGNDYWLNLKEQRLAFFNQESNLWRLSLASNTPALDLPGNILCEWNGALRWLSSHENEKPIRNLVREQGGHAVCYRQHRKPESVFHPLQAELLKIHRQLKNAFDPNRLMNPGRMYADI